MLEKRKIWSWKIGMLTSFFAIVLLGILPVVSAERTFESFPEFKEGDYFKYEIDEKLITDFWSKGIENDENYEGYENANFDLMTYTCTGEEEVTVDGKNYDCVIFTYTWKCEFTLKFKEGTTQYDDDKITITQDSNRKEWETKSGQTTVKEENTIYLKSNFKKDGEEKTNESESTSKVIYNKIEGTDISFPLQIGNTWSTTKEKTTKWEESSNNYTDEEKTNYEVISENSIEVPAGTFNCLKIKIQILGQGEGYDELFLTESGYPAKQLSYNGVGKLFMSMELKEFKMANGIGKSGSGDDDEGFNMMFIIPIVLIIGVIAVVGIVVSKKKSSATEIPQQQFQQSQPFQQQQQFQQPQQQFQQSKQQFQQPQQQFQQPQQQFQQPQQQFQQQPQQQFQQPQQQFQQQQFQPQQVQQPQQQILQPQQQFQQPQQQILQPQQQIQQPQAQQQPPGQMCPTCRQPLRYIEQYQKWYCDTCQRYV